MSAIARLGLFVAALVLQTALLNAALPGGREDATARTSLAGQFLIAAPAMGDPRFEKTVILIVEHDEAGALGIVLNRPVGEETLKNLLEAVGEKSADATGSVRIFAGGPVQPQVGFVVHSADYRRPETIAINDRLALTSSVKILRDIASKSGPVKSLVAFGYAGWGPNQLEKEIEAGAWATAESDPALVFDSDRDTLWDDAWSRRTQRL
ncbi:MAG TPA: YqgE/AlgH family protein [Roseiarcus sp.]|nr:YqgE/AlgH family protein [Roseiarcus sp.]